jgi:hypothetical protein
MKQFIIIISALLLFGQLNAQKVSFTAAAPKVVALGEQFQLTYKVNAAGKNFRPPSFVGFSKLMGPQTGNNSSTSIVNGKVSRVNTFTFTYVLAGTREGKHTIQAAKIVVNGKTYSSNVLNIEVVKSKGGLKNNNPNSSQPQGLASDDVFVRIDLSKTEAFVGEQIVATLKVYTRTNNIDFTDATFPSYDGFYKSEIKDTPKQLFRENYKGEIYFVGIFQKNIIIPQKSGEITIDPFELQCRVKVPAGFGRDFFGRKVQNYKTLVANVKSHPRILSITALPANKPRGFTGAVGEFKMTATIDKKAAKTNEAITLKYKIAGNGNIKLIDPFEIKFPPDFDDYDPKVRANLSTTDNGVSGTKSFDYMIIPRYAGDFTIPAVNFTYFDTRSKEYRTLRSDEYKLHIEKGDDDENTTVVGGISKENVKFIGKDIRYITTDTLQLRKIDEALFGSFKYWFIYILGSVLFLLIFLYQKKRSRELSNVALLKTKRANKQAVKRLKLANSHLKANQSSDFYQEILSAINGYLSDKMNIPPAEMTRDKVLNRLSELDAEKLATNWYVEIMDTCEFAQYAPGEQNTQMQNIYTQSMDLIGKFEQIIKK